MKLSIQMNKAISLFVVFLSALVCFALAPTVQAVSPPPDGGYPGQNTAEGDDALLSLTSGQNNTAIGSSALSTNTDGSYNTAIGATTLLNNINGDDNTATGSNALGFNTSGFSNTATGSRALESNTTGISNTVTGFVALSNNNGNYNTAIGEEALFAQFPGGDGNTAIGQGALDNFFEPTTGNDNTVVGGGAGADLTTGSNNIIIGVALGLAQSNTIRIGKSGTQTKTVIAGIRGATVASGVGVIVGTTGQLGTVVSSARFKEAIKPMDKASESILGLKPVAFRYKEELDPDHVPQFGLIAEEVEKVNPDLVARDEDGKITSVRYEAVNAMLLNEFLKEHKAFLEEQHRAQELEANAARQQKQIEALTAGLQKVSTQIELRKPSPQTEKMEAQLAVSKSAGELVANRP
jgi:hypothetical protein